MATAKKTTATKTTATKTTAPVSASNKDNWEMQSTGNKMLDRIIERICELYSDIYDFDERMSIKTVVNLSKIEDDVYEVKRQAIGISFKLQDIMDKEKLIRGLTK